MILIEEWVGDAFTSPEISPDDDALSTLLKIVEAIFTQDSDISWYEVTDKFGSSVANLSLVTVGKFIARIQVEMSYQYAKGQRAAKIKANTGLKSFYTETLPSLFALFFGVKPTGQKFDVPAAEVEGLINKVAGRVSSFGKRKKIALYDKLVVQPQIKGKSYGDRVFSLEEYTPTRKGSIFSPDAWPDSIPARGAIHFFAAGVDIWAASQSYTLNMIALNELFAQDDFSKLDPINGKSDLYQGVDYISKLVSISADAFLISKYLTDIPVGAANVTTNWLNSNFMQTHASKLSRNVVTKLNMSSLLSYTRLANTRLNIMANGMPGKVLVGIANLTTAGLYARSAYLAGRSGNEGLRDGYTMSALACVLITFTLAGGVTGGVVFVLGMAGLWQGSKQIDEHKKSEFENLLYNCFWGKSKFYAFWHFLEQSKMLNTTLRKNFIQSKARHEYENELKTAFEIESQEFINYFFAPQVSIERQIISNNELACTYQFILPEFKLEHSQLHGTVFHDTWDVEYRSVQKYSTPDRNMTKVLREAVNQALNDPSKYSVKDDGLHLTVTAVYRVYNAKKSSFPFLKWYYEVEPGLVVPKRSLNGSGVIGASLIGMIDEQPISEDFQ